MENHCGWFETKYPEVPVRYIMIHQTTKVSKLANFTHDVRVLVDVGEVAVAEDAGFGMGFLQTAEQAQ